MARYDASREKACTALLPQAPYDSATRGIHVHPNSEHYFYIHSNYALFFYFGYEHVHNRILIVIIICVYQLCFANVSNIIK